MPSPNSRTRPAHRSHWGFTLIELLTVVAILAVLLAVLLPALARARQTAKKMKCQANLRQIGIAFTMYFSEHGYMLPQGVNKNLHFGGWDTRGKGRPRPLDKSMGLGAGPLTA